MKVNQEKFDKLKMFFYCMGEDNFTPGEWKNRQTLAQDDDHFEHSLTVEGPYEALVLGVGMSYIYCNGIAIGHCYNDEYTARPVFESMLALIEYM